jgi:hypothetical protein
MSTDILEEWAASAVHMIRTSSVPIRADVIAKGGYERHWDPPQFARIEIGAAPSEWFQVEVALDREILTAMEQNGFLKEAIFGVMDVLIAAQPAPILRITLRISGAELGPFSTQHAFRMAGRDAGRRLVEAAQRETDELG